MKREEGFDSLERGLRDLASSIAYPEPVDVSARVLNAIESRQQQRRFGFRLAPVTAVVALCALAATLLVAFPATREAIADFLGISGVEIRVTESPRPTPIETGDLNLGEPTSLSAAQDSVSYDLRVPTDAELGDPDGVFLEDVPVAEAVTLLYEPSEGLPATLHEIGALLTQFEAGLEDPLLKKLAVAGTRVRPADIGDEGYWIAGDPHEIYYVVDGQIVSDRTRLASNTLLWEQNGVSYRFESSLTKDRALAIARSLE